MSEKKFQDKDILEKHGLKVKIPKPGPKPITNKSGKKIIRNVPSNPTERRNQRINKIKAMLERDKPVKQAIVDDTRIYSFVKTKRKNNGKLSRANDITNKTKKTKRVCFIRRLIQKLNSKFKSKKKIVKKSKSNSKDSNRAKMLNTIKKEVK